MKNFLLLSLILLALNTKSQIIVNKVDISSINPSYISVYAFPGKLFDNMINAGVNYGQPLINIRNEVLSDQNGEPINFNSEIDMLNFFNKNGYIFLDTYLNSNNDGARTIFLLKRKE